MSFVDEYFSIVALFILFRETVEASIIIAVLLQFLHRSFPYLKRQVWWGVFCGLILSIAFGVVFSIVFYVAKNNIFTGQNKQIFKGAVAWFAAILITVLAFAMLRYKGWEEKIKRKLEAMAEEELEKMRNGPQEKVVPEDRWGKTKYHTCNALAACWRPFGVATAKVVEVVDRATAACWNKSSICCRSACQVLPCKSWRPERTPPPEREFTDEEIAATRGHGIGIFLIVFTTVLREGIESVIFLAGVGNAAPSSLPLPGVIGAICGVAVGLFLYFTGKQVKDIKWFVIIMGLVLFFVAAGQIMLGALFLTEGGMFGEVSIWINDRPKMMQPAWDLTSCCAIVMDDPDQQFWVLMQAIFGYQDKPTYIQVIFYFSYWAIVILAAIYKWRTGSLFDADYKFKRQMAKEANDHHNLDAQMELADKSDVLALTNKLPSQASRDLDSQTTGSGDGSPAGTQVQDSQAPHTQPQQVRATRY